jgi:hypothetical protein
MSLLIKSTDDLITVSYLKWSIPLHLKDKKFSHFGIPTYDQKMSYDVDDIRLIHSYQTNFRSPDRLTFFTIIKEDHGKLLNKDPVFEIGEIDKNTYYIQMFEGELQITHK